MFIEREVTDAMLAEVARFARERIAAVTARPESPIGDEALEVLTRDAIDLGVLPIAGDEGFALWEHPDNAASIAFSIAALTHLGQANGGVAFAWHRAALARAVAKRAGLASGVAGVGLDLTIAPTGHYGLARTATARWITGQSLDEAHTTLLADWLDRRVHPTTLVAPRTWRTLLWPVWRDGAVQWTLSARDALDVQACKPAHGLDELAAFQVRATDEDARATLLAPNDARQLCAESLTMDWLGLLAIAAGAITRGQQMAASFAHLRHQGGALIAQHAAVQRMLSDIDVARRQAIATLGQFPRAIGEIDPAAVAAARAAVHPMLCDAANQVMQVHGGIGYMRDAGPEMLVRDLNMLRAQSGGVLAAHAFVAGCAEAAI